MIDSLESITWDLANMGYLALHLGLRHFFQVLGISLPPGYVLTDGAGGLLHRCLTTLWSNLQWDLNGI